MELFSSPVRRGIRRFVRSITSSMVSVGVLEVGESTGQYSVASTDNPETFMMLVIVSLFLGLDKYFRDAERQKAEPIIGA